MNTLPFRNRSGAALVITLLFLVIITLMVVGFSETSRVERVSARNHFEQQRANELAQRGLDQVTATLFKETVDPPDPALSPKQIAEQSRNWISQPGQLIVSNTAVASSEATSIARKQLSRSVRLHSGAPGSNAPSDPMLAPPDLNIQTLVDQTPPSYLITDRPGANNQPQPMRVRWVYFRQDGSWDADPSDPTLPNERPVLTDTANPIVGRYAFWADDDSSKINYNLAWKRNAGSPAHPSQINLTALTLPDGTSPVNVAMADAIRSFTTATPGRFFNSFADARQIGASSSAPPGVAAMLNYNKFELTHFNHDPDTTFFGEDRILLTTDPALVPKDASGKFARKFLDIRKTATADPGLSSNIDKKKFNEVLQTLVSYLMRTDWPMVPSEATANFAKKFYGDSATLDEVAQIAANILGYVIAKESEQPMVSAIRFSYNRTTEEFDYDVWHPPSYQALTRQPLVTEAAVWQAPVADVPAQVPGDWPLEKGKPKPLYRTNLYLELHLPSNYGFSAGYSAAANKAFSLAYNPKALSWFVWLQEIQGTDPKDTSKFWFTRDSAGAWQPMPQIQPAAPIFNTDIFEQDHWIAGLPKSSPVLEPGSYVVIKKEYYAPWKLSNVAFRCGLSRERPTTGGVQGFGNRDIIVPQLYSATYRLAPPGTPPDQIPSMETDDPRVAFSSADWKYNATGNTLGRPNRASSLGKAPGSGVADQDTDAAGKIADASLYMPPPKGVGSNGSGGDNGRISSLGELGYIHTGTQGAMPGRTQKSGVAWRTLRLQPNTFTSTNTVPDWALLDLFGVPNTGILGANAVTTPNGSSVGGRINVNSRVAPFALQRDRGLQALLKGTSISNPTTVAANIYNHQLARRTPSGAFGKAYGYLSAYDNPWEICEIAGVTDDGEASERVMREIGSLITARGDVFSIYSVGQALRQTPEGKLVVTGEQRQHSVVERVLDMRGTNDPRDDQVSLRTVYRRNLNP
jgi:hypothetical protein